MLLVSTLFSLFSIARVSLCVFGVKILNYSTAGKLYAWKCRNCLSHGLACCPHLFYFLVIVTTMLMGLVWAHKLKQKENTLPELGSYHNSYASKMKCWLCQENISQVCSKVTLKDSPYNSSMAKMNYSIWTWSVLYTWDFTLTLVCVVTMWYGFIIVKILILLLLVLIVVICRCLYLTVHW